MSPSKVPPEPAPWPIFTVVQLAPLRGGAVASVWLTLSSIVPDPKFPRVQALRLDARMDGKPHLTYPQGTIAGINVRRPEDWTVIEEML